MTGPAASLLRARVLDVNGVIVGVAGALEELKATPRLNAGGTWSAKLAASAPESVLLVPGSGMLIERLTPTGGYVPVICGPLTAVDDVADADNPAGVLSLSGVDDLAQLAGILTYPDPTVAASAQTTADAWGDLAGAGDGPVAEVIVRAVTQQLLATTGDRRIPRFQVNQTVPASATVSLRSRWEPLLEFLQRAVAPYDLGIQVRPEVRTVDGKQQVWRVFEAFTPRDVSGSVIFGYDRGTLRAHQQKRAAPGFTHPVVGGAGESTARGITSGALSSAEVLAWGRRIEQFVDRTEATDLTMLASALAEVLAEAELASAPGLSITPIDIPDQTFGTHYDLGDKVTVTLNGRTITERIREVAMTHTKSDGLVFEPLIGPEGTLHPKLPLTPRLVALTRAVVNRTVRK